MSLSAARLPVCYDCHVETAQRIGNERSDDPVRKGRRKVRGGRRKGEQGGAEGGE
jgi:hypothetical protein